MNNIGLHRYRPNISEANIVVHVFHVKMELRPIELNCVKIFEDVINFTYITEFALILVYIYMFVSIMKSFRSLVGSFLLSPSHKLIHLSYQIDRD